MTRELSVAIIGLGSRGLGVLERVVTLAGRGSAGGPVRIEVVDPSCDGAGVHTTDQPDYLLLNTIAEQVSMFPDEHTVGSDVDAEGPTLYEWVTRRGLRVGEDGYSVSTTGRPIRRNDFLPRRVLGEYLGWYLEQVRERVPGHVRLTLHRTEAVDLGSAPDGSLVVGLANGDQVQVRYAFLSTGYTANTATARRGPGEPDGAGGHRRIAEPYPLPDQVSAIRGGQTVAIDGFGLAALDLMSALTVGRGGRFVERDGRLTYLPSGDEPVMLFSSRSGLPCRARPQRVEFGPKYVPLAFTTQAIDRLRVWRGPELDFDRDVMPLILTEMRVAYRRCQARLAGDEAALLAELTAAAAGEPTRAADAGGLPGLVAALDALDLRHGPFDARALFDGSADMLLDDADSYQKWLSDVLSRDLAEGVLGFAGSPVKAALDILRDQRDMFRYAIDFRGLTGDSVDAFNRYVVPALNRAVVGPQYERHSELLTLITAGLAATPFGPAPEVSWHEPTGRWRVSSTRLAVPTTREVDWLVSGHVSMPAVTGSASPIVEALRRRGWIRRYRPEGSPVPGIDIDADQHPIDPEGQPRRQLWVLGPICEGATFYNNLVPSPNTYSRPVFDAHRCVVAMFADAAG
jgi:uncharacterized NAD(P)/FAD-binding protein YdhS